jgi:hypothetical protein
MNMNLELTADQTRALTACMLAVSNVDGVHPAETALIQQFYEGSRGAGMPAFADLQQSYANAMSMLQQLPANDDFNDALVSMCLMTGYADGTLSDGERDTVLGFARSVGVGAPRFDELLQQVRDSLLGSLASLPDAESVAALAKEL